MEEQVIHSIHHHQKSGANFYVGSPNCHSCDKPIEFGSVCRVQTSIRLNKDRKKEFYVETYCLAKKCLQKAINYESFGFVETYSCILIEDEQGLPPVCRTTFLTPQRLGEGRVTDVFEAATTRERSVEVEDRTRLGGGPSIGGAQIGKDLSAVLEEKDNEVGTPVAYLAGFNHKEADEDGKDLIEVEDEK